MARTPLDGGLDVLAPRDSNLIPERAPAEPSEALGATEPLNPVGPLDPAPQSLHHDDPVLHLANRLAHGPTPSLVREIQAQTPAGWVEAQLHPELIDDTAAELAVAGFTSLHLTPGQNRQQGRTVSELRREVRVAGLLRAVHSRRQLLEVMVEFWRNRFSIEISPYWTALGAAQYEYGAIRPHALGRFHDLLLEVTRSPAMLDYLDNARSRAPHVNENHARELLELHTLGVDGGYGEQDVRNAAYALSGWGFDQESVSFVFRSNRHDERALTVMDWHAEPGNGVERGESLLAHLARHPATAFRLAVDLGRWFVGGDISTGLANRAAKAYLTADTDLVPMLRVLLLSDEFLASRGAKLRQPVSQLAAWLRATDAETDTTTGADAEGTKQLERLMVAMGQQPWGWPTPDGHPDDDTHWAASAVLVAKWRSASRLAGNQVRGVTVRSQRLGGDSVTVGEYVDALAARLLSLQLDRVTRDAIVAFGGGEQVALDDLTSSRRREIIALVLVQPAGVRR